MFWTKIWLFLVSTLAVVAFALAFAVPKPASRTQKTSENLRLRRACQTTNILLKDDARGRIKFAEEISTALRVKNISTILAKSDKDVTAEQNAMGRKELRTLLEGIDGSPPSFVMILNQSGQVVAQSGEKLGRKYGESLKGYYLVDDALSGYVLDDIWFRNDSLYRVAGAPLLDQTFNWAGAIVVGHQVNGTFATNEMKERLQAEIAFFDGERELAASNTVNIGNEAAAHFGSLKDIEFGKDCIEGELLEIKNGKSNYQAVLSRLPGEAGTTGAYYAIFMESQESLGFMGALKSLKKEDMGFGTFPWIKLLLLLLVLLLVGVLLLTKEIEKPLKNLTNQTISLSKGELTKLPETENGKFGGIARSVNLALEKFERGSQKGFDASTPPPKDEELLAAASSKALKTPPPSKFKFSDQKAADSPQKMPSKAALGFGGKNSDPAEDSGLFKTEKSATDRNVLPAKVSLPGSQPRNRTAPPVNSPALLDDDILGSPLASEKEDSNRDFFKKIFEEFMALKIHCGENTSNLTLEKFTAKLQKNKATLMAKHNCKDVSFRVYEKNGKAALKASPKY